MQAFNASCPPNEAILMTHAQYGRMRLGMCLNRDYFVGCSADVLRHMDSRCSGRGSCTVNIPDPTLFQAQPCPQDLVAYLEADFTCVRGQCTPLWQRYFCGASDHMSLSRSCQRKYGILKKYSPEQYFGDRFLGSLTSALSFMFILLISVCKGSILIKKISTE